MSYYNNKLQSIIIGRSVDTWNQLPPEIRQRFKNELFEMQNGMCGYRTFGYGCGKQFIMELLEVDHVIAISLGGPVCDLGNMQLLCRKCHKDKTREYDMCIENRIPFKSSKKYMYSC